MQDISQDTLNESAKLAQSARITLWEIRSDTVWR